MITNIKKRDGSLQAFDPHKIKAAMTKAFAATKEPVTDEELDTITAQVVSKLDTGASVVEIEHVQDVVERCLMSEHQDTAKAYILYRKNRSDSRRSHERLFRIYDSIYQQDASENDAKRENVNIDCNTAMGSMLKYGSEGAKEYNLQRVLSPRFANAHMDGDIHIHDLDFLTLTETCCQIDLDKLFRHGFGTGDGSIRTPQSIGTYASLAAIAIQANQNEMHGGQSVPKFDYDMAPGVRKTYKKNFAHRLIDALEDLSDNPVDPCDVSALLGEMEALGDVPTLEQNDIFNGHLAQKLSSMYACDVTRAIRAAHRRAHKETEKATFQAMEGFIHNMNTMHSRAGGQVPFSSISYGTDTSPEGRLVTEYLLKATIAGMGHGEEPIFPCQIFKLKKGVNFDPGDPNYDLYRLALRCTAKRMYPNYDFLDAPFNLRYYKPGHPETEATYMGCRTRVMGNVYDPTKEIVTGRGNLSFTSINLPRLAIEAHGDIDVFMASLDAMLDLVRDQLLERFRIQCRKHVYNYPFLMGEGIWIDSDKLKRTDEVSEVLKHGTMSIGFIGLAETLKALIGKHHGESREAQELGLKIVGHMRDYCDRISQKMKLNFTLLATPAEGLSGRFVRMDRKRYGVIPGVTDREYYTNSSHVPVYYNISAYDKIHIEAPYHELENAGHIAYVELDADPEKNLGALDSIIKCMAENGVGYGAINIPLDRDPECGYTGIINNGVCPKCGRVETADAPFQRFRRVTGYLGSTLDRFNDAKKAEVRDRVKHFIPGMH